MSITVTTYVQYLNHPGVPIETGLPAGCCPSFPYTPRGERERLLRVERNFWCLTTVITQRIET